MNRARRVLEPTVGKKIVMAVTGILLFGFVAPHMIGNLQIYLGAESLNRYSVFLHEVLHGAGLWIARAVLLTAAVLHVWAATSLTLVARAARPVAYREWRAREATYASRSMRVSGVLLLAFILYHLLDLTFGTVNPSFDEHDVYHNVIAGFRVVPVALFYVAAMGALGMHLWHGVYSMFQTLGVSHPRYERLARRAATAFAAALVAGNVSFPLAVLLG